VCTPTDAPVRALSYFEATAFPGCFAFRASVDEWSKVREQWVADRKQRLLQRWEETSFRLQLKQIEQGMRLQRRRLRAMSKASLA
jgi:hypothetical protein